MVFSLFLFYFFKQKTAYEMRISDWSSDVCSSDLDRAQQARGGLLADRPGVAAQVGQVRVGDAVDGLGREHGVVPAAPILGLRALPHGEVGVGDALGQQDAVVVLVERGEVRGVLGDLPQRAHV